MSTQHQMALGLTLLLSHFVLSTLGQPPVFAKDTSACCVLNILVREIPLLDNHLAFRVAGKGTFLMDLRRNALGPRVDGLGHRVFHRFEFKDTGRLLLMMESTHSMYFGSGKSFSKSTGVMSLTIQQGEYWLPIRVYQPALRRIYKGRYKLLTNDELSAEHPSAFEAWQRRGFHFIHDSIPLNTDPREPPKKTSERWPTGY